jgi:hypothetical protein
VPTFVRKELKMKRIISLVMVLISMLVLAFPAVAETTQSLSPYDIFTLDGHAIYYQSTDDYIITFIQKDIANIEVSFAFRSDPDKIYVYNIATDNTRRINAEILDSYKSAAFSDAKNAKVFICKTVQQTKSSEATLKKNAVINKMKQIYGTPYTWRNLYTDSTTYSPLTIRVREDLYYSSSGLGISSLPKGVNITTGAVGLASAFNIPVSQAIQTICNILGVYDISATLSNMLKVEAFRGVACKYRTGTVTPSNGSETSKVTASQSYVRTFCFDYDLAGTSSSYASCIVDSGNVEILYAPSEYSFNYITIIEDTYDAYIG